MTFAKNSMNKTNFQTSFKGLASQKTFKLKKYCITGFFSNLHNMPPTDFWKIANWGCIKQPFTEYWPSKILFYHLFVIISIQHRKRYNRNIMTNLHRTLIQQGDNIQLKNPGQVYSESTQTSNRSFLRKIVYIFLKISISDTQLSSE